jgi:endonuclease YncB( thermonuclease family)
LSGSFLKPVEKLRRRSGLPCKGSTCARIRYKFLRAIHGDTIQAAPPGELWEWMRDVHVRLYGIDAPERGQEKSQLYTDLLNALCSLDNGDLRIV